MTRSSTLAVLSALTICAMGIAPVFSAELPQTHDPYTVKLDIGRLEIMVEQTARLIGRSLPPEDTHEDGMSRIKAAASRFNSLLPQACRYYKLRARQCKAVIVTGESQDAALDMLFPRVYPVWRAACNGRPWECPLE